MCGRLLCKRGQYNTKWQRRWVSVTSQSGQGSSSDGSGVYRRRSAIRYFHENTMRGCIHLSQVKDVVAVTPTDAQKDKAQKDSEGGVEFHVKTEDRTWSFLAQDSRWMGRWVEAIKGEIELIREQQAAERVGE